MMPDRIRRVFSSVFSKLLLVIIITGVLINLVLIGYFWKHRMYGLRLPFTKNIVRYVNYLADDIGNPPNLEKAREVSSGLFMTIRFQGPGSGWTTAENNVDIRQQPGITVYQEANTRIVHSRHFNKVVVDKDYGRFEFITTRALLQDNQTSRSHAVLAGILSILLIGAFLVIRHILNPIKALSKGVREVGTGNLEYKISINRSDEFGALTDAFNAMTKRVHEMLHAREQLLLDVSHELRTPITRMKVALEFLPKGKTEETLTEDILEMETMVTEILESARLMNTGNNFNPVPTDLPHLVRETTDLFGNQLPGISVGPMIEDCILLLDPKMIRTVLNNILMNALKYSDKDGAPVNVSMTEKTDQIIIDISDSGAGIPEDELPRIFEPFYRVDKSRSKQTGGYGLGLSLCKTIMDAHDGKIEVTSVLGHGTTVSMIFKQN